MIRIAYICADVGVPVFGNKGCSVHVQELMRALAECGAHIDLFTTRGEGDRPAGLECIRVHPLPSVPKGDLSFREQKCLAMNGPLKETLDKEGGFDLVYERYSLWSYAAMEFARAHSIPAFLEINAPLIEEQAEYRGLADRAGAVAVARRLFAAAHCILAVSEGVASYLEQFSESRKKVRILPNAVRPDRFPAGLRAALPAAPGTFTVGFVGSMKPWHGVGDLMRAFAQLQAEEANNRLLLVGDGPARAELQELANSIGISGAVQFTGAVSPAEVPALLASMDVAVAPYQDRGNFYFSPLKVCEYMAAELPVVATAVGQLKQIIEHGVTGVLIPSSNCGALAAALIELRRQPKRRARLGQAARAKVLSEFTWERNARRILHLAGLAPDSHLEGTAASAKHVAN